MKRLVLVTTRVIFKTFYGILIVGGCSVAIVSFQRVVIVLHGEKPPKADMDEDLKKYFNTNSYIESRDPQFWNKLRYFIIVFNIFFTFSNQI